MSVIAFAREAWSQGCCQQNTKKITASASAAFVQTAWVHRSWLLAATQLCVHNREAIPPLCLHQTKCNLQRFPTFNERVKRHATASIAGYWVILTTKGFCWAYSNISNTHSYRKSSQTMLRCASTFWRAPSIHLERLSKDPYKSSANKDSIHR